MYLKDLNDVQKALTLDILLHAMEEIRRPDRDDRARIEGYCAEMGIPVRYEAQLPLLAALPLLADVSNTITLRKVLVELAMLAMADAEYDVLERAFIDRYAVLTGIKREEFDRILQLLEEMMHARLQLDELVNEPV